MFLGLLLWIYIGIMNLFYLENLKYALIHHSCCIWVASRVAEWLKTLFRKFSENLTTRWKNILVPNLPSKSRCLTQTVKNYAKADIKVFWFCLILLYCLTLFQIFCPRFYTVHIPLRRFSSSSLCFLDIFSLLAFWSLHLSQHTIFTN